MKRSKEMIISKILDICTTGTNKTAIVYQANLNFNTADPYIRQLVEKEMIEVQGGNPIIYKTTEKGIEVLRKLCEVHRELERA